MIEQVQRTSHKAFEWSMILWTSINRFIIWALIPTSSGRYAAEIQLSDFRFCASTINGYSDWPTVLLSGTVIVSRRNDFDGHSRVTCQFSINLNPTRFTAFFDHVTENMLYVLWDTRFWGEPNHYDDRR